MLLHYLGNHENHIIHSNAVLVESAAAVGLCCMHNAVFLKEKLTSVMCLIAFYTATDTVTDLVNIECNRQPDAMLSKSCLVHPVDRFDIEGWFSCN